LDFWRREVAEVLEMRLSGTLVEIATKTEAILDIFIFV
jgi:hypothetical protein